MRICIFGAGAVGGHFAVRLAAVGHEVSVIARGAHLEAIRDNGLVLQAGDIEIRGRVAAADRAEALGPQDLVITTAKAPALAAFAAMATPLLGPETPVLFAQNGIPWWYPVGLGSGRPTPPDLRRLDPDGALARAVAPERVIGGVIHSANSVIAPGVILNASPERNRLTVGEPDDADSPRIAALRVMLEAAGIESPVTEDIRQQIWLKLMTNMTVSILCLVTGRRAGMVRDDPRMNALFLRLAAEAKAIATAHGIDMSPFDPVTAAQRVRDDHTPSTLEDRQRGRPLELDSLLLVPLDFARAVAVDTPCLDTLAAVATNLAAR